MCLKIGTRTGVCHLQTRHAVTYICNNTQFFLGIARIENVSATTETLAQPLEKNFRETNNLTKTASN